MHFKTEFVMAVQGHPRSLISVPLDSAKLHWSCLAPFQRYCTFAAESRHPTPIYLRIVGVSFGLD